MTQPTKADYYVSQWQALAHLQITAGIRRFSKDPIVALAAVVLKSNGQLQQPFLRFLEWSAGQINQAHSLKKDLFHIVETKGSDVSKEQMQSLSLNKMLFPAKAAKIILTVLQAMEQTQEISKLYLLVEQGIFQLRQIYSSGVLDKNRFTEEGISIAFVFLVNQVGLKTIQLVLSYRDTDFRKLMERFYLDDTHPMDLQKLFRDPIRSPKVGYVITNLMKINEKSCLLTRYCASLPMPFFNSFLVTYVKSVVQAMSAEEKRVNLLGIPTMEVNIPELREKQESYYSLLGIGKEQIVNRLQFSTPGQRKGIYLYPQGEIPQQMGGEEFLNAEQEVFLKVPDANRRVVVISKEGFQSLEKLQLKMTQNLFQLMQKLTQLFPDHMVTGRVKSARSLLDKCGRLCEKTQAEQTDKCVGITDIIDGCGCRITCSSSFQIFEVIRALKDQGFEFLELDNKYNTIRKDGAYKVIPCTLKDRVTGLIFELQITTLTSTVTADLFHNVIYKRNTIGLNPTDREINIVLAMERFGSLTETISLVARQPIVLTEKLKDESLVGALDLLREMAQTVLEKQRKEHAKL